MLTPDPVRLRHGATDLTGYTDVRNARVAGSARRVCCAGVRKSCGPAAGGSPCRRASREKTSWPNRKCRGNTSPPVHYRPGKDPRHSLRQSSSQWHSWPGPLLLIKLTNAGSGQRLTASPASWLTLSGGIHQNLWRGVRAGRQTRQDPGRRRRRWAAERIPRGISRNHSRACCRSQGVPELLKVDVGQWGCRPSSAPACCRPRPGIF